MLLTYSSFAQNTTVSSSKEEVNNATEAFFNSFLGSNEAGYFLLRKGGPISNETILIEQYDQDLNYSSSYKVLGATGVMGDGTLHRKTLMNNGVIYNFYEGWKKSDLKNSYIVQKMNKSGSEVESETVLETETGKSQMKSASYDISFSPDGSKLAVLTQKPFAKGEKEQLRIQVFATKDLSSIWKNDVTLDVDSKKHPRNELIVNNAGTVCFFKDVKISGKEHYYQWISVKGDKVNVQKLDLKGNYPTYGKLKIDGADNFVYAAMLSEIGNARSTCQNLLFLKADVQGTLSASDVSPLGSNLLWMIVSEKNANSANYKLDDYVLKDVKINSKNEILLIAEHQTSSKAAVGTAQPPVYNYTYNYGGVMIVAADASGKRLWNTFYSKKQSEVTRDAEVTYGSFASHLINDELYLLWNYTDYHREPLKGFRYWEDMSGAKINLDNLFGPEAVYPTLLTKIKSDGSIANEDKTFMSEALSEIQKPNAYKMAIDPDFSIVKDGKIIVLSRMESISAKRYKFNTISVK